MSSFWNNRISISIFGEADAPAIGVTIDNLPAGEPIDTDAIARFMSRRSITDPQASRSRNGLPRIMSGISRNRTSGAPLCAFLNNPAIKSVRHDASENLVRPGHADYTGAVRYRGYADVRSSSIFADKMTAPLCFAGAVCAQILERRGIYTGAHILSIHNIKDNPFDPVNITRDGIISIREKEFPVINDSRGWKMLQDIRMAAAGGETLGGVIECASVNVPAGIGSPIFNGLENSIAQLVFGIPGIRGLEFGSGFRSAGMVGSQNNDDFYVNGHGHVVTRTNNHGGILGGISSGMPVTLKAAVMPPAVTGKDMRTLNEYEQSDVDSSEVAETVCTVAGTVPCIEAAVNIALLSHMLDYPNFC